MSVNATTGELYTETIVTEDDGNYTCAGEIGERAFWLDCNNYGTTDDKPATDIFITGNYKESKKSGKLNFQGKGIINISDSTEDEIDEIAVGYVNVMKGKFLPDQE